MASLDLHELQSQQEGAAAAIAAIYFCCLAGTALNLRLTGFKLYIPVSIAAAVRAVSFVSRAAFYATANINLMAVTRALQAIGLGISIAMCSCFLVIWLRNARPNHQPLALPPRLTVLCKLLVACVIAMGPFLGIAAAAILGAKPTDQLLMVQAMHLRQASATGFLVVISVLSLCTAFVSFNWLRGTARSKQQPQPQQQQQLEMAATHTTEQQQQQLSLQDPQEWQDSTPTPSWQQQLRGDGLILLLLACNALLLWSSAALVASLSHPELQANASLHHPLMVLPELLVAILWAMPTVTARIALGARFGEWRQQQMMQRQAAKDGKQQLGKSVDGSSDADVDAEAVADGSVGDLVKTSAV